MSIPIPPIFSSGGPFQFPSDDPIVDELQNDLDSYKEYMKKYMDGDHSQETLKDLQNAAKKLLKCIKEHKKAIEQICKNNGWPAHETGGYDECIQGIKHCAKDIAKGGDIPHAALYMMNEDASGIISMMTEHR